MRLTELECGLSIKLTHCSTQLTRLLCRTNRNHWVNIYVYILCNAGEDYLPMEKTTLLIDGSEVSQIEVKFSLAPAKLYIERYSIIVKNQDREKEIGSVSITEPDGVLLQQSLVRQARE